MRKKLANLIDFNLSLILLLAILVRLPLILQANKAIHADIVSNLLTMKKLISDGDFQLFYFGIRYGGIWEGLLVLPVLIMGNFSPISWSLGATLIHLLFIFTFWQLARKLFEDKRVVYFATLFLAFSPWEYTKATVFSLLGGYTILSFWFLLVLVLAKVWSGKPRLKKDFFYALLISMALYHYKLFQIYLLPIGAFLGYRFYKQCKNSRKVIWHLFLIAFFTFSFSLLISVIADLTDHPNVYADYSISEQFSGLNRSVFWKKIPLYKELLSYFSGGFSVLLSLIMISLGLAAVIFYRKNKLPLARQGFGVFSLLARYPFVFSFASSTPKPRGGFRELKNQALVVTLALALFFTLLSLLLFPLTYISFSSVRYLLHIYPVFILLFTASLLKLLSGKRRRQVAYVYLAFLIGVNIYSNYKGATKEKFHFMYQPLESNEYYRLCQFLKGRRIDNALASYWIAYPTTYFCQEEVVIESVFPSRYPPFRKRVLSNWPVSYITKKPLDSSPCKVLRFEDFYIYIPKQKACTPPPPEIIPESEFLRRQRWQFLFKYIQFKPPGNFF